MLSMGAVVAVRVKLTVWDEDPSADDEALAVSSSTPSTKS